METKQNRVLVQLSGDAISIQVDDGVNVCLLNYNDEPNAEVPLEFADLLAREWG